jgi:hypothetical protein
VALEAQRRRRHWKQWPWGLIALGLAVLFTVGMFGLVLIGASVRRRVMAAARSICARISLRCWSRAARCRGLPLPPCWPGG